MFMKIFPFNRYLQKGKHSPKHVKKWKNCELWKSCKNVLKTLNVLKILEKRNNWKIFKVRDKPIFSWFFLCLSFSLSRFSMSIFFAFCHVMYLIDFLISWLRWWIETRRARLTFIFIHPEYHTISVVEWFKLWKTANFVRNIF